MRKAQEFHPDIAVLDIRMPGLSGIAACRQIVSSVKGCKVILLTAYAEDELLFEAVQAGAVGYVLKQISGNELVRAIELVNSGEGFLDSAMIATIFNEIYKATKARHAAEFGDLSSQEMTVLSLVTKGMTNRQIAGKLYLGEGTTRNYISSVLAKLAVANRAEASAFAVKHNIQDLLSS